MEYLGLDILIEILSRLGVKDLIRFKSVSKTFLDLVSSLISSHNFIRLHLNKSSLRAFPVYKITDLCLKQHGEEEVETSLRVIHVNRHNFGGCLKQHEGELDEIVTMPYGSCNGLVCLWPRYNEGKYAGGVLLWNPALHEAECVPIKRPQVNSFGCWLCWFGYDNDEYKLILATRSHIHLIRLFIDTNAWKSSVKFDKDYNISFCEEDIGTLVHRTVHWSVHYSEDHVGKYTIISYDLRNETVGRIMIPDGVMEFRRPFVVGQVDGCLSIMFANHDHVELWVMKEYSVGESWTKAMILPSNILYTYHRNADECDVELDDPAQLCSPIYSKRFYVESLISPRSLRTKMC